MKEQKLKYKKGHHMFPNLSAAVVAFKCPGPCGPECPLYPLKPLDHDDLFAHMCHPEYYNKHPEEVAKELDLTAIPDNICIYEVYVVGTRGQSTISQPLQTYMRKHFEATHRAAVIKTDANPLDDDSIKRVIAATLDMPANIEQELTNAIIRTDGLAYPSDADALTIRQTLPTGETYYIAPEGQSNVTLLRTQNNDGKPALVDVLRMPTNIVNQDCDGTACRKLLQQIMEDFHETKEFYGIFNDDVALDDLIWNDVMRLPDSFLRKYGITVTPIDTTLTIEVDIEEPLFPMNDESE